MPNDFSSLLDELAAQAKRRRAPNIAGRRGQPHDFRSLRPGPELAKALAEIPALADQQSKRARQMAAEALPARIEDIKARGRELVARSKAELSEALRTGRVSGMEAIKMEAYLNAFSERMAL